MVVSLNENNIRKRMQTYEPVDKKHVEKYTKKMRGNSHLYLEEKAPIFKGVLLLDITNNTTYELSIYVVIAYGCLDLDTLKKGMEYLDDNSDKITEYEYLHLCNRLRHIYKFISRCRMLV